MTPLALPWLMVAHVVCDYPLQGDFLARGKNIRNPIPSVPWWQCLAAHALIQGGGVALVTGQPALGTFEFGCHWAIDYLKCCGAIDFNADQFPHVICKVLWTPAVFIGTPK
jgi:hypothetical protein